MSEAQAPPVSRGLLVLAGAVLGLAVLAAVWFFVVSPLLEGTQEAPEVAAATDAEPAEATPAVAEAAEEIAPSAPIPETMEVFSARDPFQQLVRDTGAPAGEPSASTDGSAAPASAATEAPVATPAVAPAAPAGAQVGATNVRLVDVFTDDGVEKVLVTVNTRGFEVAEGETFADRFRVLDIDAASECATFLFGDNRFTLCKGEEIRK